MTVVAYPTTLPNPTRLTHRPNMRAVISDLPGRPALASKERSYSGAADVEFFFNSAQAAEFYAWWNDVLARGGYWFNTSWPAVLPGLNTCQFITDPVFSHVYNGAFKISATVQVRPNSGDLAAPDPYDDLYAYVRWLFLAEGVHNSSLIVEQVHAHTSDTTLYAGGSSDARLSNTVSPPFGTTSVYFGGARDRVEVVEPLGPWNIHSNPYTLDAYMRPSFLADYQAIFGDDSAPGGGPFNAYFITNAAGAMGGNYRGVLTNTILGTPITALAWQHVAFTGDGNGNHYYFVNGVNTGHATTGFLATDVLAGAWMIGCQNYSVSGYERWFTGYMKCMRCTVGVTRWPGTAAFEPPTSLTNYLPAPA